MRFLTLPFVVTAAALAFACAGPEDLSAQTATLTDFCNARATAECTAQIITSCHAKDASACVAARAAACIKAVPQGTTYVPAAGPACVKAVSAAYGAPAITATALANVATTCEPIFSGPGAARSQCTVDYDCSTKDGLRCLIPYGATQGKCLQPNMIDAAGPCPSEGDVCSGTYYCDPASHVCVAQGGEGAQCDGRYPSCIPGYKCPNAIFVVTCQPLKAAGEACTIESDCASNLCDKATGQSQGVCADQVQLTALDSMCAVYQ